MDFTRLTGLAGLAAFLLAAVAMSRAPRRISPRTIFAGLGLQLLLAVLVLKTTIGQAIFAGIGRGFRGLLSVVDVGCEFVFGPGFEDHFFAFKVLPSIVFFSSLMAILYHLQIMPRIVAGLAWLMQRSLGTSGAESMAAAANVFLGQTEAPLVVRPYLPEMTDSELAAVMTGGFATVSAGMIAAYAELGIDPGHLVSAAVISAPASLVMAKILEPETGTPKTLGSLPADRRRIGRNMIEAAAIGVEDGLRLAVMVGGMLLVFLGLIALTDAGVAWIGSLIGRDWSLAAALGFSFAPAAWLMGVPWEDCTAAGELLGLKMAANELVAYQRYTEWLGDGSGVALAERTRVIMIYALCGFANLGSIGVQVGGIASLAPERRGDLSRLGFRTMLGGTLACFTTACLAGVLL